MAGNRNFNRRIIDNNNDLYYQKFLDKGVKSLRHLETTKLSYPTQAELLTFEIKNHIWHQGDTLEKISSIYYGGPEYWWILAIFNQKPTEQHYSYGDNVLIPLPLSTALNRIG